MAGRVLPRGARLCNRVAEKAVPRCVAASHVRAARVVHARRRPPTPLPLPRSPRPSACPSKPRNALALTKTRRATTSRASSGGVAFPLLSGLRKIPGLLGSRRVLLSPSVRLPRVTFGYRTAIFVADDISLPQERSSCISYRSDLLRGSDTDTPSLSPATLRVNYIVTPFRHVAAFGFDQSR